MFSAAIGDWYQMLNQGFALLQDMGLADEILDRYDPDATMLLRTGPRRAP